MPVVKMPDGTQVQFPDDMPTETIRDLIAKKFPEVAAPKEVQPNQYTGQILPISVDAEGKGHFDSNAGLLGMVKRAFMLPGDAMAGKVDPTSEEGIGRAAEFASVFSPMTPAVRAGEGMLAAPNLKKARVEPPSASQLKAAGDAGYEAARNMDVTYSSQAVADMAQQVRANLESRGIIPEVAPKTFAILDKLQSPPEGSVATISGVEAARRAFGHVGQDFSNLTDRGAGKFARGAVDDFLTRPPANGVLAGGERAAEKAARTIANARGNIAASKRSGSLTGIGETAELRAAAANSGANTGNAIRSRVASLVTNPKQLSGFTDAERAQLEAIVRGTLPQNITRAAGNLLGGGGGLGSAVSSAVTGTGAAVVSGNPVMAAAGLAAPVAGAVSKQVSNNLTRKALEAADAATRKRSPLYQQMVRDAPMVPRRPAKDAANLRMLLLSQAAQEARAADRQAKNEKLRKGRR